MSATVYKWVDAQGVTHYSDQPHPEAQTIDVQPQNLVHSSAPAASNAAKPAEGAAAPVYKCELTRPENDEVFLNTSTVSARLKVEPQLGAGDQVALSMDGKRLPNQPVVATDFVIPNVERGSHTLTVVIYDRTGRQPRCSSAPVTFHVRQPSVQAPVKATRPKF